MSLGLGPRSAGVTDDVLDRISRRLVTYGVYVREMDAGGDAVRIEYESLKPGDGVVPREAGQVINVFRESAGDGWEPTDIVATVYADDGSRRGEWRMERAWLEALSAGELSEVEFSRRVIASIDPG